MVTQALAIPLAPELPTPNSRKTCALAIWLLQTQRLPTDILAPAKDRITYALRRAVEGELGKEGKKGAISDGMKVSSLCTPPLELTHHPYRLSMSFPLMSPPFSCLRSSNSSLPSSRIYLDRDLPCELTHVMPSVAWLSVLRKFPSPLPIRASPKSSAQHSPVVLHRLRYRPLVHPAPLNLIRCSSKRCARRSPRPTRRALHRVPSGPSARSPLSLCFSALRWSQVRNLPMLLRHSSQSPYVTKSRLCVRLHVSSGDHWHGRTSDHPSHE